MNKNFADISSNNIPVNLGEYAKAGYPLIAIKLGGGLGDQWNSYPMFGPWWQAAKQANLARWAYWYWRASNTATTGYDQAKQVEKLLAPYPQHKNDRIVLDFETMLTNPSHNVDQARQFLTTLKNDGHYPLLYASPGFLSSYNNPQFDVDLWIADYADSIWNPGGYNIAAWQHGTVQSGRAIGSPPFSASGIGLCDMSVITNYGIRKHLR
ncbi:MAG: GH25 family lysozyme [Gammaproteobacteria bacterium]